MRVLILLMALTAGASDSIPAPAEPAPVGGFLIPGMPPGPAPPADQVDDRAFRISLKLRCPVCQGQSVADSTSEAAVSMQRRIREMVAAGYSQQQIEDYFTDRYGEWILLDPPPQGLNWVIWLAPGLAFGLGLVWTTSVILQWRKEPEDPVPLPSDSGLVAKDKYEERLLAELDE